MTTARASSTYLRATCHERRLRMHAEHPITAASRPRQALRRWQSLQVILARRWAQMEAPPQSLQVLLRQLCSQRRCPRSPCTCSPQSLHLLLTRLCSQITGIRVKF